MVPPGSGAAAVAVDVFAAVQPPRIHVHCREFRFAGQPEAVLIACRTRPNADAVYASDHRSVVAVYVSPATRCRCMRKKTATGGSAARSDAAATRFHDVCHIPRNDC